MTMPLAAVSELIEDVLCGGTHFLGGVHKSTPSVGSLLTAAVGWSSLLGRDIGELAASFEPALRQSVVMSLIPAKAVAPSYDAARDGSLDAVIVEHLDVLGLSLSHSAVAVLRNVCINVRKLQGLDRRQARNQTATLGALRSDGRLFDFVWTRQAGRCVWCGVPLDLPQTHMTLEHVAPKHIGDDMPDAQNWALACSSCNSGKADAFAWAAVPEAHDYIKRSDFGHATEIALSHRWIVLVRTPKCFGCQQKADQAELWVYRRVRTGLPIPSMCSTCCSKCGVSQGLDILSPRWSPAEASRPAAP